MPKGAKKRTLDSLQHCMKYRSYVIIFVIRPCGKREVVPPAAQNVNSDVQSMCKILDDAMLVEKIVAQVNS